MVETYSRHKLVYILIFALNIVPMFVIPIVRFEGIIESRIISAEVGTNVYCHASGRDPKAYCYDVAEKVSWSNFEDVKITDPLLINTEATEIRTKGNYLYGIFFILIGSIILLAARLRPKSNLNKKTAFK